jgi:hypothetical protein
MPILALFLVPKNKAKLNLKNGWTKFKQVNEHLKIFHNLVYF